MRGEEEREGNMGGRGHNCGMEAKEGNPFVERDLGTKICSQ
jgi:hypothetical protein